jgi:hypothetical protein
VSDASVGKNGPGPSSAYAGKIVSVEPLILRDPASNRIGTGKPPPEPVRIEKIGEFGAGGPKGADAVLWKPIAMDIGPEGDVYVVDSHPDAVTKFDGSGRPALKFGRNEPGQGGLSCPTGLWIHRDRIAVAYAGNRRLQFFTPDGVPTHEVITLAGHYRGLVVSDAIFGVGAQPDAGGRKHLLEILSDDGRAIRSFGEPIKFNLDESILNDAVLLLDRAGFLRLLFRHLPILRTYRRSGELVDTTTIVDGTFREREKANLENYLERPDSRPEYVKIFRQADICDGRLYLFDFIPPRIWIRRVDPAGLVETIYWDCVGDDFSEAGFKVRRKRDGVKFYLLREKPEPSIVVYAEPRPESPQSA